MHPGSRPQSPPTDYRDQPNRARPSNRRISQSRPKRPLSSPRPPPTVGIPGSPLGPGYPPGTFPDTGPPSSSIDIKGANVDVDRTFSGQTQRLAAEEQQASHPAAAFNQSWPESDASGGGAREAVPALKSPGPKQAEFHQPPPPPSSSTSTLSTRSSEKLLKLFRRSSVLSTDTLVNSKEAAPGPAENSGGSTFLGRIHQRSDSTSSYGTLASSPRLPTSPSISTGDLSANAKRQPSLLKKASYNSFKSRDTQYSQQALPTEDAVRPGPISTSSSPLTRMTKTKSEQGERGSSSWRMGFSKRSASAQQQQQQPQQQLLAEAEQSHLQGSKKTANPWDRQAAARAGRQVSDSKLMGLLDSQDGKDRASFRAASMSEGLGALGSPSSRFRDPSSGSGSLGGKRSKLERLMGGDVPPPTEPSSNASVRGLPDHSSDFKPSTSSAQHPHTGSRGLHHNASSGTIGNASSNGTFGEDSRYKSSFATSRTRGESERSSPVTGWADLGEADCPVCLEPLSYRLAGEKPHVMPTCGHALHNACFTAVYGPTEAVLATQSQDMGAGSSRPRNTGNPPGMCGVCRRPIVLGGDDASGKGAKLAGMMGLGDNGRVPSAERRRIDSEAGGKETSLGGDDPVDAVSIKSRTNGQSRYDSNNSSGATMVTPLLKARPEYSTIYRKDQSGQNGKQNVVCVVTVEIPSRRLKRVQEPAGAPTLDAIADQDDDLDDEPREDSDQNEGSSADGREAPGSDGLEPADEGQTNGDVNDSSHDTTRSGNRPSSPDDSAGFSFGATPALEAPSGPFASIMEDLRQRMTDWKGHAMEHFGPLVLYDFISVRQDTVVREFFVYLFREALLCVTEEKRKGLSRFISGGVGGGSDNGFMSPAGLGSKPPLKLKGRIYLRHIRRVVDSSAADEMSLSIKMDDDSLDQFVLCFKERSQLETWKSQLSELVDGRQKANSASDVMSQVQSKVEPPSAPAPEACKSDAFDHRRPLPPGQNSKRNTTIGTSGAASIMSGKTGSSSRSPISPRASLSGAGHVRKSGGVGSARLGARNSLASGMTQSTPQHQQWSASGGLDPGLPPPPMLPHTPLDLVLMFSVPTVVPQAGGAAQSSAALKLRLIRSSLEFIVGHLGPRDRVALIAFSVGVDGEVRRTALLCARREKSKERLDDFIEGIGKAWDGEEEDPFREDLKRLGGGSDRTDTVTAVNVGLDVVLQRKNKNPVTGMILISDTVDGPRRGQMDLVMARAEAANVPIHCFGYGKSHDPSSLWLISNHTRGSYTFVKEWYQLRECLAGCIGSLMSIALTDVKLYVAVPSDNHFRVRKVAGPTGAIVSATGKDVDIELGELRFGDCKEVFIELELDFNALVPFIAEQTPDGRSGVRKLASTGIEQGSATDEFMQRLGLQGLSLSDTDFFEGQYDNMIEEVAVFEVDAGFHDPALGTAVSRLPNPTVLTVEVDANAPDPVADGTPGNAAALADPIVTRRRLEILVSDMITRSLLLVSRKNYIQALKILTETRRIIDTVVQAIPPASAASRGPRRQRDALNQLTLSSLGAILEDLYVLTDGLENNRNAFDRDMRNFGAQQAMVLRDQKAWSTRTDTEFLHFTDDNAPSFAARAAAYAAASGRER